MFLLWFTKRSAPLRRVEKGTSDIEQIAVDLYHSPFDGGSSARFDLC